jgi:hypothetical protein
MDQPFYPTLYEGFMAIRNAINRYMTVDAGGSIAQAALDRSNVGAGPVDVTKIMKAWRKRFERPIPEGIIRFEEFDELIERWNQATQQGEKPETFEADRRWVMNLGQKPYAEILRELEEEKKDKG